jgi:hypothetical protein
MAISKRHVLVDDDTFEEIYTLKGSGRTMGDVIRELLHTVYPHKGEDGSQQTLEIHCPECDEILEDGVCPGCGYPDEE